MKEGDRLAERGIAVDQHFTEPPPRYTEASLIKKMEELGIGRPSTYTAILSVLRDRDYVRLEKRQLIPEDKGRLVTAFLSSFFERYVEYDFTAELEEKLDEVSNGDISWKDAAARLLAAVLRPTSTRSRTCASPRCSMRSTSCSARTSSRRAPTAATRASARPAAPASCR